MLRKLRSTWRELERLTPGERFQCRYRQRHRRGRSRARKVLFIGGGGLVILAGLVLMPAPGPGFVFVLLGGALMAEESLLAARALDFVELRIRRFALLLLRIWQRCSAPTRCLIVLTGAAAAAGVALGAYWLLFGR